MIEIILIDKKKKKRDSIDKMELDLNDLELYSHYKHGEEFFKIPSSIIGNKTVLEWFVCDNVSYWWFISPIIHSKFKEATTFIDRLFSLTEKHSVNKISLKGMMDKQKLVVNFCKFNKIDLEDSSIFNLSYWKILGKNNIKKTRYKKIAKNKIKKRISSYNAKKKQIKNKTGGVIITSPGVNRRLYYDLKSQKVRNEEFVIKPFLEILKNKYPILCIDFDYTLLGTVNVLNERLDTEYNWIPIEILQQERSPKTQNVLEQLKSQYKKFKNNHPELKFVYRGISLWEYLEPNFDDLFLEPNLPTYINLVYTLENFLKEIKPKVIIQTYETGPFAKAIEVNAKKLGIKTIGIQHGLIPTDNGDYIFKECYSEKEPFGNLIPDITCVFGNYYKKMLTEKGTYPKNKVIEIGNPSYFQLEEIRKNIKKEELLKKYSLPNKKIVLVPLSFRFLYVKNNPDKILLNSLYQKYKNNNDVIFMIRTHPGDDLNFKQLQELYPSNNFLLSQQTLVEDLIVCDCVVVLPISSVSTEAALFEKPVIMVNVIIEKINSEFNETYQELIKSEIAILVNVEKIDSAINSIKQGELWNTNDSIKRKAFLENYFHIGKEIDLLKIIFE